MQSVVDVVSPSAAYDRKQESITCFSISCTVERKAPERPETGFCFDPQDSCRSPGTVTSHAPLPRRPRAGMQLDQSKPCQLLEMCPTDQRLQNVAVTWADVRAMYPVTRRNITSQAV
jgi:hypothetical protein